MKNVLIAGLVLGFGLAHVAKADAPWGHVNLESTDGTQIVIDYQTPPAYGNTILGAGFYLNVFTPQGSDCEAPVRVVIGTSCGGPSASEQTVDLIPAASDDGSCHFTIDQPINVAAATHAGLCEQQLSVVVKGDWLADPANGTNNFHFTLPFLGN